MLYMEHKRTTVLLTKTQHERVKLMALMTNVTMQEFIRIALQEKLDSLKREIKGDNAFRC